MAIQFPDNHWKKIPTAYLSLLCALIWDSNTCTAAAAVGITIAKTRGSGCEVVLWGSAAAAVDANTVTLSRLTSHFFFLQWQKWRRKTNRREREKRTTDEVSSSRLWASTEEEVVVAATPSELAVARQRSQLDKRVLFSSLSFFLIPLLLCLTLSGQAKDQATSLMPTRLSTHTVYCKQSRQSVRQSVCQCNFSLVALWSFKRDQ